MNRLSLWCLITIHAFSLYASDKCYSDYLNISLTSIALPNSDHKIDLEDIEPFKKRPFKSFILETKETDTPWLLALCHNDDISQAYNALDVIRWYMELDKNPRTNGQITDIEFFTFEHIDEHITINRVGTFQDLNNQNSLLRLLFSYMISTEIEHKNNIALHISNFYSEQMGDLSSAIRWCQKAAKNNDLNSIAELGYLFKEFGDLNRAFFYLNNAAERGDIYAAINLGNLYAKNGNFGLALHWLTIGAHQGVPEAMSQLGNLHYKLGETTKAIQWLTDAVAINNNPATIADLAFAHRTKKEFSKALDLYLKAAELGLPTLDLFYTLHLAIGYPAHENTEKFQKYADMLVDKINKKDQYVSLFKRDVPDRYHIATDMIERYATKPILHLQQN